MPKRKDHQHGNDALPPMKPGENPDTLTDKDEAALDKAAEQITDAELEASVRWVNQWDKKVK